MDVIDIHAHAFPDAVAERAMPALEAEGGVRAALDGKVSSLLASMDRAGIATSVICSIATKPEQFEPILKWSGTIASERLVPFPSVHPDAPDAAAQVARIREAGLRGVKLHPYYQRFTLDEPRMMPIYEAIRENGLVLMMHTGFDFAFPRDRIADPVRVRRVLSVVPGLKLIASHLGAWDDWDEVEQHLLGREIYLDTSFALAYLGEQRTRRFLLAHPPGYLLFGTDSPWADQVEEVERLRALHLPSELEPALFSANAHRLLGV